MGTFQIEASCRWETLRGPWSPPHWQSHIALMSYSVRSRDVQRMEGRQRLRTGGHRGREDIGSALSPIQEGLGRVRKDTLSLRTPT